MRVDKKYGSEPFEAMFRRFKKGCEKSNILLEVKKREYFEKHSSIRKRNKEIAIKKEHKRQKEQKLYRFP